MRRDLIHTPKIEDGEAHCSDCGAWLPLDESISAAGTPGAAVLEVGGLGAYCVTVRNTLGREAILCSHPSVASQSREITVMPCPACQDYSKVHGRNTPAEDCETCGGSGMIGTAPDPDDPENPKILKVTGGKLSDVQMSTEGLSIKESAPLPEFEKAANRGAFQNWLGLRDAIRPEDVEAS